MAVKFETRTLSLTFAASTVVANAVVNGAKAFNIGLGASAKVVSMTVLDYQEATASPSLNLVMLNASPSGVVAHATVSTMSDSSAVLGVVQQGTANYVDPGQMKVMTALPAAAGMGLVLAPDKAGDVWVLPLAATTTTFTAATAAGQGLDVILGLEISN